MDNNKKQVIDEIMNELVEILIIDYKEAESNTVDKKNIDFKYRNGHTVNSVIKNVQGLCLKDYPFDIIRDETYASMYEVMLKISKDYTEDELNLILQDMHTRNLTITNQFFVSVYKLTVFKVKFELSGYRRCSSGLLPAKDYLEYSDITLSDSPANNFGIHMNPEEADEDICFFIDWFNNNKETFLTTKQLQFIEDDSTINQKNHSQYRKRIYNATLQAYLKEFNTDDEKENELISQIKLIEKILEAEDFAAQLIKHRDKQFILEAITSHVSMPTMQAFNKGSRETSVIKEYRVSLFKKLSELNDLLDSKMKTSVK